MYSFLGQSGIISVLVGIDTYTYGKDITASTSTDMVPMEKLNYSSSS